MELRRRVVAVAPRTGSALGDNDPLLLEVADHARRQTDRFAGRPDSRKLVRIVV
jgi:hypothetical protein